MKELLNNEKWVHRVFLCFDPFFSEQIKRSKERELRHRNSQSLLIDKLWRALSSQQTQLQSRKSKTVMRFLYSRLSRGGTLSVLNSFRYLFMLLEDWVMVSTVEFQILQRIASPIEKLVKISNFILYWYIVWDTNFVKNVAQFKEIVEGISID